MRTKSPFRLGAVVKIVRPEFVWRVGYPMSFTEEMEKVLEEKRKVIIDFLTQQSGAGEINSMRGESCIRMVAKAMASQRMQAAHFGGRTRSIHTKTVPHLEGQSFRIQGIRFVKTGEYQPADVRTSYDGDDYEPAFLSHEKTHRLLMTPFLKDYTWPGAVRQPNLEIESCHCELVTKENP